MSIILKRLLYIIGTGAITVAACAKKYGMPVDIDFFKVLKTVTENNEPIMDLSVNLIVDDTDTIMNSYTNSEGTITFDRAFYNEKKYTVEIKDIDGDENLGEFITTTQNLTEPDTTIVIMNK